MHGEAFFTPCQQTDQHGQLVSKNIADRSTLVLYACVFALSRCGIAYLC